MMKMIFNISLAAFISLLLCNNASALSKLKALEQNAILAITTEKDFVKAQRIINELKNENAPESMIEKLENLLKQTLESKAQKMKEKIR